MDDRFYILEFYRSEPSDFMLFVLRLGRCCFNAVNGLAECFLLFAPCRDKSSMFSYLNHVECVFVIELIYYIKRKLNYTRITIVIIIRN